MKSIIIPIVIYLVAFICIALCASMGKVEESVAKPEEEKEGVKGWGRPPYLMPQGIPAVFGNASVNGNVGGLFAVNNSTLTAISGPEQAAIASLNSSAVYYAMPINETNQEVDGGWTNSQNLAGFTVTAQEDTSAYAEGEWIQFINHGGSYATGFGESNATGGTYNPAPSGWVAPAPQSGGWVAPVGSGWKGPQVPLPVAKKP